MFGFLRKSPGDDAAALPLDEALEQIEQRARDASPSERAALLLKAAERCTRAGVPDRARAYHGRAIDTLIEGGDRQAAAELCRKLVVNDSNIVRARGTLATLLVEAGAEAEALLAIRDYARVSRRTATEQHAITRLCELAERTSSTRIRACIRETLFALGARKAASAIQEAPAEPAPPSAVH